MNPYPDNATHCPTPWHPSLNHRHLPGSTTAPDGTAQLILECRGCGMKIRPPLRSEENRWHAETYFIEEEPW